jgi:hypothetical protein
LPLSHILRLSAAGALLDIHSTQQPLLQPHRSKPQICYNPPTNARLKYSICELQGNEVDARMFEASGYAFSSAGGDAHSNGLLFTSPCGDVVTVNTSNWRHTSHTSHLTPHTSHLTPHTSHLTPHTSHLTPPGTEEVGLRPQAAAYVRSRKSSLLLLRILHVL